MAGLDAARVFSGSYGKIFKDGMWLANFNHLEASVETQKRELLLSGSQWVQHKKGPFKGTGTMSGFKVTSEMIQHGFAKFELISTLEDPEAYGFELIKLKNCMVDKLQLANFTAGEEVTEEIPFTFEEFELYNPVIAS